MAALDPETLEKLRRGFLLRMDRMGRLFLGDDPITHPGVTGLFRRGLDLSDQGEPIVRLDEQWTYVDVADCVLRALAVVPDAQGRPALVLDDERTLRLDPAGLWEEPGQGLRCTAPSRASGRSLSVRFTNTAQMDLQPWLLPAGAGGRPRLCIDGLEQPIPEVAPG